MSQTSDKYTDKNYPIEPIWVLKSTLVSLIFLPFAVVILTFIFWSQFQSILHGVMPSESGSIKGLVFSIFFILSVPLQFVANIIRRATFHYHFGDKFLNLHQGVINRQNRQLHYGVIQNVLVTRGLLDRLFGLSTLVIQNATQSSEQDVKAHALGHAGFFGNTIQIPGLSKENAEEIKHVILKKIKDSPTVELGM
jgi:uncharacterized membrane protein YdbT with pleckstrin-like domain